jgi:hypothetical protein
MARLRKEQLKLEKIKRRYKKNEDDSSKKWSCDCKRNY